MTFAKHNVIDLAVVVLPMVPALRALRLFKLSRIAVMGARVIDRSETIVERSNTKYVLMLAALVVLLAGVMVWSTEHQNPQASIHSLSDAVWWTAATETTVGHGDKYPVSLEGRIIALSLMLLGIALFGLVSATLASLFVESNARDDAKELRERLERVEDKLDLLLNERTRAREYRVAPG